MNLNLYICLSLYSLLLSAFSQEVTLVLPQVKIESNWTHQFLSPQEISENRVQLKDNCQVFEKPLEKVDIFINVAAPQGTTIILPCIYCGYYPRQRKNWYRANFTWVQPWNTTLNKVEIAEYYSRSLFGSAREKATGKPDELYRVVKRQDSALVITNFTQSDTGLYSCFHRFKYDKMKGRMTYIVDLLSTYPGTVEGDYDKLRQFKNFLQSISMDKYKNASLFFNETRFVFFMGPSSECRGCGGEQGYRANLVTTYLEHNASVPPVKYHKQLQSFSPGIHIRSSVIQRLNLPKHLRDELHRIAQQEFTFFTPCMNYDLCPDPFAADDTRPRSVVTSSFVSYTSVDSSPSLPVSLSLANLKNETQTKTELLDVKQQLYTTITLLCQLQSREVAVWYRNRTAYGGEYKKLTSSVSSNITKWRMKADKVMQHPAMNIAHKAFGLGMYKNIFSASSLDKEHVRNAKFSDSGVYTCYGRHVDSKMEEHRKEYLTVVRSMERQLVEGLQDPSFIYVLIYSNLIFLAYSFLCISLVYFKRRVMEVRENVRLRKAKIEANEKKKNL